MGTESRQSRVGHGATELSPAGDTLKTPVAKCSKLPQQRELGYLTLDGEHRASGECLANKAPSPAAANDGTSKHTALTTSTSASARAPARPL